MTTTIALMTLFASKIADGGTAAGERIYTPGDFATFDGQYPCILLRPSAEDRVSLGRGTPQFTTTSTMQLQPENRGLDIRFHWLWPAG